MHFGLVYPKDAVPEVQKFKYAGASTRWKTGNFLEPYNSENLSYFMIMDLKCTNIY